MEKLFTRTIKTLADMVDARESKHRLILSNVANIDTPGFKPSEMSFRLALQSAGKVQVERTAPNHLKGKAEGPKSLNIDMKESNNEFKLDTEMVSLAENQLLYNATVEILSRKFRGIQTTLREAK